MSRVALNTVIALSVLAGAYVVWELRAAVVLFVLSLALAASLRPFIVWLTRRGLPNLLSLTITYLIVFIAFGLLFLAAAGPLMTESQRLGDDAMLAYQTLYDSVPDKGQRQGNLSAYLPPPDDLLAAIAGEQGRELLQTVLGATFTLFGMAVDLVIIVFLGMYWSIDQVQFERLWLSLLPLEHRRAARDVWRSIEIELGSYVRSELIQSVAAGVLLWIGYRSLGQPYPVLIALVGAIAWLIPWVGVLLAVGAVVALSTPLLVLHPHAVTTIVLPAVAYTSVVLLIMQHFVEPRFFDRRRYNSFVTAVIIFGMADVAGILGLVLGAPLAAVLQIAGGHWVRSRITPMPRARTTDQTFQERLSALRSDLHSQMRPSPELVSLIDRLAALVEQTEEVLGNQQPDESEISRLVAQQQGS